MTNVVCEKCGELYNSEKFTECPHCKAAASKAEKPKASKKGE